MKHVPTALFGLVGLGLLAYGNDADAPDLGDRLLGEEESGYDAVDDSVVVQNLLSGLDEREQEILRLRFFERLSQDEIAERVGVSQSYLSRVLRRTLQRLREEHMGGPLGHFGEEVGAGLAVEGEGVG